MKTRRILALILALALALSLFALPASAAGEYEVRYGEAAESLWKDGLFLGTGASFALDQPLVRSAGITMLVRLLGKEAEAKAGSYTTPFTDTTAPGDSWMIPYVGYAYANGLTKGTGDGTTFSPNATMSAAEFLTLVLRALGYDDKAGDFAWNTAPAKALEIGLITQASYSEYTASGNVFRRDNAALISYNALSQSKKGTDTPLSDTITLPGRPAGDMPKWTDALAAEAADPPAPSDGLVSISSYAKADIKVVDPEDSSCPADQLTKLLNPGKFVSYWDDMRYSLYWYYDTPEGVQENLTANAGVATLHCYVYLVAVESSPRELGFDVDRSYGETGLLDYRESHPVKAGQVIEYTVRLDLDAAKTALGPGEHGFACTFDGTKSFYSFSKSFTDYSGKTFLFEQGKDGGSTTWTYKYAGGKAYAATCLFTLCTGAYGGSYTMTFPIDETTSDSRSFTAEANSTYHISYTYGLTYDGYDYTYRGSFALGGAKSASISFTTTHPGELSAGSFLAEKVR